MQLQVPVGWPMGIRHRQNPSSHSLSSIATEQLVDWSSAQDPPESASRAGKEDRRMPADATRSSSFLLTFPLLRVTSPGSIPWRAGLYPPALRAPPAPAAPARRARR